MKLSRSSHSVAGKSASFFQQVSYSLPLIPAFFLIGPLNVVQGIYAKHFGLTLTTIAAVVLFSRLFDAITDPLIGYYSDQFQVRTGSRKLFVALGGVLFVICSYFLFVPSDPNSLNEAIDVSAFYFLIWFFAFYFAFTLFEIPHIAWGGELMADSHGKTVIYGLRTQAAFIGLMFFYLVPLLPIFETNGFTPKTLFWAVLFAGLLMLPTLYLCIKNTPNGNSNHLVAKQSIDRNTLNLRSSWQEVIGNKPLLMFLTAFVLFGTGTGMWFSLQFIYIDTYLNLGDEFAMASLIGLASSILIASLWVKLSCHVGKKIAWGIGVLIYMLAIVMAGQMEPYETSVLALVMLMILSYGGAISITILVPSLLSDIVDYSTWKFGTNRAATYFALQTLVNKITAAIGSTIGLAIAGSYGFDPSALLHSADHIFGIRLAASWIPAPILLLSIIVVFYIPIDGRRHAIIRRRLDGSEERARRKEIKDETQTLEAPVVS